MTRTVSAIAFIIGMVLAWGFPVMPVAAEPGFVWGTAERIETDAGDALRPGVAVDPQGNALAVWQQLLGIRSDIRANRFVPGVGWGTAELIETEAGFACCPQVAVDPQGNAVTVWNQRDGNRNDVWANRFVAGVGWGTAERIETEDVGEAVGPQVAIDPQGNAVAVWEQFDGTRRDLWANRFVAGVGWGTAELLETDEAGHAFHPQVAVDPQGNAVAVWEQHDGIRLNLWANRFVPGVGWGTAELIETGNAGDALRPQVAVDPQGNALAVWEQHDGIRNNVWANRLVPGVGWGTAELIETGNAGDALRPQVAVDPQGNALAVWQQLLGIRFNIWANRLVPGVGWGRPERIETDDVGDALRPRVAVDPQGNALAVWEQFDGTRFNIRANRFVPGPASVPEGGFHVGWGTAELLETDEAGHAFHPQVAVDPQGNAVAVWEQFEGARLNIWANRGVEVEVDTVKPTAVAGIDQTAGVGETLSFDASVSSDNVAVVSYAWDFGDGTTGTGETTTHVYSDPGTYTVTLTVRDAAGNADTDELIVTVETEPETPPPSFQVPPVTVGALAAAAAGVALLLWRRRAGGKERA